MKKIILSIALLIGITGAYGQKANVSKAKSKATSGAFGEARELIKQALADPNTANEAETWYVAGFIEAQHNEDLLKKAVLKQPYNKNEKGEAIIASIPYFLKADEFAQIPDAKGKVKNKYRKDIVNELKGYYNNEQNLYIYGAELYDDKHYKEAYHVFKIYLEIPDLPIMEGSGLQKDSVFLALQYYAALAASNAKMPEQAIEMYKKSISSKYEQLACYQLMSNEYREIKDTVGYVKTLQDGFSTFPKEPWFLQNLINHYIFSGQETVAVKYLDDAIANEPDIAEYYYVKGLLEEKMNNIETAEANFNKSLEIDPNMAGAYAGKGRLIFNKALILYENANQIKDNKAYNAEMEKAENLVQQSMPLFRKAVELNDKEVEYLENLKLVYYRLNMVDEYNETVKKINALGQ